MRIGVLAEQGAFAEHIAVLRKLKVEAVPVRLPQELGGLDGLIIPGGESTSISKLLNDYKLTSKIISMAKNGFPVFGTCAGMILLSKDTQDPKVKPLGLMDIKVQRNAFGRQLESFEADLDIPVLGKKPFHAVFIRAPWIEQADGQADVLAKLENGTIVAIRQGKLLATAFHPELTNDLRFHRYFLELAGENEKAKAR
jgi:5'-phosphate synthase pdxT subunit